MHTSVLLRETIEHLQVREGKKYIDATYGLGGHAREIIKSGGIVLGIDYDAEHVKKISSDVPKNCTLVQGNYANIKNIAQKNGFKPCEGIVFDLGLSMDQISSAGRGFSYKADSERLDMRINPSLTVTAEDIINNYNAEQLYEIFATNSEELNSRPIAHAIVNSRSVKKIHTVGELKNALGILAKNTKVLARIFQALRIEVNDEYENIRNGIRGALNILSDSGRIAVTTFHPSEDRIVKQLVRAVGAQFLTKKPIVSKDPMSFERSAKLRIIHK